MNCGRQTKIVDGNYQGGEVGGFSKFPDLKICACDVSPRLHQNESWNIRYRHGSRRYGGTIFQPCIYYT